MQKPFNPVFSLQKSDIKVLLTDFTLLRIKVIYLEINAVLQYVPYK